MHLALLTVDAKESCIDNNHFLVITKLESLRTNSRVSPGGHYILLVLIYDNHDGPVLLPITLLAVTSLASMSTDDTDTNKQSVDEESPLLLSEHESYNRGAYGEQKFTPLPKVQMSVISLLLLAEPMCTTCISPFINHVCDSAPPV
jgi:hypothetical protein